ncbi:MAG TPA: hypothetical protein DCO77_00055 [Nitrospiraceae bacterium]|nr:hypothetical protein [Nitrospiraceae bacterium]
MNCREFKKCPEETHRNCPAYPDRGLECWKVTGTRCERGIMEKSSVFLKIEHCSKCDFYVQYAHKF